MKSTAPVVVVDVRAAVAALLIIAGEGRLLLVVMQAPVVVGVGHRLLLHLVAGHPAVVQVLPLCSSRRRSREFLRHPVMPADPVLFLKRLRHQYKKKLLLKKKEDLSLHRYCRSLVYFPICFSSVLAGFVFSAV